MENKGKWVISDVFEYYMSDIKGEKSLTVEEEKLLLEKINNGDLRAKKEFFERHLKFVVSIAKEYVNDFLDLNDLISEGNYGLLKAMEKYDFSVNTRFMSYAVFWIRQSILHSINKNSRTIRIPENILNDIKNNTNTKEIPKCVPLIMSDDSNDDSNTYNVSDYFIQDEDSSEDLTLKNSLNGVLNKLNKRDRKVITLYFGLDGGEPMNLEEIGHELDLSKERVRQLKNIVIRKLKHFSRDLIRIKNI